jgi:uncharacterized membrane protein
MGSTTQRLDSVDRLRGLVMVLMALDHTKGYFLGIHFDPLNLTQTTPAIFFTRWISHLCAPTFMFLAGAGAYLAGRRGKTKPQLAWFLLTRGLWIVLLELTLVRLSWTFDPDFRTNNAGVLWAIGWSMVCLAGLVFLPTWVVTVFGLVMIAGHNLFDRVRAADLGPFSDVWAILHEQSGPLVFFGGQIKFYTQYPLVPWIGVMATGYGFGSLLLRDPATRRNLLIGLGTALCVAFVIVRAANVYGDPDLWSAQRDTTFTILSFLNCHKYPPSLCYLLMTLGPALLLLAFFERAPHAPGRPLLIFGRVPMFFYLIHIPLIHGLMATVAYARYGPSVLPALFQGQPLPADWGYNLPVVYGIWLGILLVLYLPCRWFAGVKARRRDAWLSYI